MAESNNPLIPQGQNKVDPDVLKRMQEAASKRTEEAKNRDARVSGKMTETKEPTESEKIEEECNKILEEYGGLEGNIPIHHGYWTMRNMARAARTKF